MRVYDVVQKLQDCRALSWSERVNSSGTAGTYLKARTGTGVRALYYKLPRYTGVRFDGSECVNEVVASRLMDILGIDHVPYRLVHALIALDGVEHEVWLNTSRNFRRPGEQKMGLGAYYDLYKEPNETPWEFCRRNGWDERIGQMMLVDYLVTNRDRHASNIEVVLDQRGMARLAPLFDQGLSLLAPYGDDEERIAGFAPLTSVATTNFVGSRSLEENLRDAMPIVLKGGLAEGDRERLLAGLEHAAPAMLLDKIWEVIWTRWRWYEGLKEQ